MPLPRHYPNLDSTKAPEWMTNVIRRAYQLIYDLRDYVQPKLITKVELGAAGSDPEIVPGQDGLGSTLVIPEGIPAGTGGGVGVIGCVVDGGGAAPSTGSKGFVQVPFNGTITGWTMLADQSGDAQITVSKSTYSGFPATANITALLPPHLAAMQKNTSTTLTGWTTALAAGDVLEFTLDWATTVERVILELQVTKT